MDRVIDQTIACALAAVAGYLLPSLGLHAPAFLFFLSLICLWDLASQPRTRDAVALGALLAVAVGGPLLCFAPVGAALATGSADRRLRPLWIVALLVGCRGVAMDAAVVLLTLSAIVAVLTVRTANTTAEAESQRRLRDGLRERYLSLEECQDPARDGKDAMEVAAAEALQGLTDREQSVLGLVAEGLDNREVAGRLYLSEGTVRNHVSAILRKKQLHNRAQLIALYYRGPRDPS